MQEGNNARTSLHSHPSVSSHTAVSLRCLSDKVCSLVFPALDLLKVQDFVKLGHLRRVRGLQ